MEINFKIVDIKTEKRLNGKITYGAHAVIDGLEDTDIIYFINLINNGIDNSEAAVKESLLLEYMKYQSINKSLQNKNTINVGDII
jgi:hypothetical protein